MQDITSLAERLKKQIHQENAIIQDLAQKQLNTMGNELRSILQQELNTIKADIQEQTQSISWRMLRSRFLWPSIIGLSFSLSIFSGAWAVMHYLSREVMQLQQNITRLKQEGAKIKLNKCDSHLCAQIDVKAAKYQDGYRILKGY